jgi:hypothetical protein
MVSAYTTYFTHSGTNYTAIVCRSSQALDIYFPDETLHQLVPQGKVSLDPRRGLEITSPRLTPKQHLLLNVLTAIEAGVAQTSTADCR